MHERIRRFTEQGITKDGRNWIRIQDDQRNILEERMRREGYVPNLDCDVHWSPWYDEANNSFKFKISMYGVFVGRTISATSAVYYENKVHDAD